MLIRVHLILPHPLLPDFLSLIIIIFDPPWICASRRHRSTHAHHGLNGNAKCSTLGQTWQRRGRRTPLFFFLIIDLVTKPLICPMAGTWLHSMEIRTANRTLKGVLFGRLHRFSRCGHPINLKYDSLTRTFELHRYRPVNSHSLALWQTRRRVPYQSH